MNNDEFDPVVPATPDEMREMTPPVEELRAQGSAPVEIPQEDAEDRLLAKAVGNKTRTKKPKRWAGRSLIARRGGRFYANFRSPFDGRRVREALRPPGHGQGTTDPVEAGRLAQALLDKELELVERRQMGVNVRRDMTAQIVVREFLKDALSRVERGDIGAAHARQMAYNLRRMLESTSLGRVEDMRAVKGPFIKKLVGELRRLTYEHPITKRSGSFTDHMIIAHMMALSGVFTWLVEEGHMEYNPVPRHSSIPAPPTPDIDKYLEVDEAAALIQFVRHQKRHYLNPFLYEIIMTQIYTGGRIDEIMSLRPDQVDFAAGVIVIQGTKNNASKSRSIPMWAPLRECLTQFYAEFRPHGWPYLFPARAKGTTLIWRKRRGIYGTLAHLVEQAGIKKPNGPVTHHWLRHTYASARLSMVQLNPMGQLVPVSPETVRLELGHAAGGKSRTLEKIYSHALRGPGIQMQVLDYEAACRAPRVSRNGSVGGVPFMPPSLPQTP